VDGVRPASDREIFPVYVAAYLEALGLSPDPGRVVEGLASIFNAGAPSWMTVVSESAGARPMIIRTLEQLTQPDELVLPFSSPRSA
jgi:hypothetical protein